jgi:2-polyprenyl-3-methyl-5-hydroxy-6-metoxy-1,4-benzoquinol methylase
MTTGFVQREVCPLCGSKSHQTLCDFAFDEAPMAAFLEGFYGGRLAPAELADGRYRIERCAACNFIFQDRILNAAGMQHLYQDWVDQASSLQKKRSAKAQRFRQYAGQARTLMRLFDKPPQQTRVLDYGMGWGYWCRMVQAHGFDVSGYELSASRRAHAQQLGVPVVDHLQQAGGKFDFIYANQVFEHLPDPRQALQELCRCLHADGIVYLRVPDGRDVLRRLRRDGWSPDLDAIHPLEHINCFTRATLIQLAASVGLRPFQAPLRLEWGSLYGGIRREIEDRWFTTHLMFRR